MDQGIVPPASTHLVNCWSQQHRQQQGQLLQSVADDGLSSHCVTTTAAGATFTIAAVDTPAAAVAASTAAAVSKQISTAEAAFVATPAAEASSDDIQLYGGDNDGFIDGGD